MAGTKGQGVLDGFSLMGQADILSKGDGVGIAPTVDRQQTKRRHPRPTTAAGAAVTKPARPWRRVLHQHPRPDHGGWSATSTARRTVAAGPTPSKHTQPCRCVTQQHRTADDSDGSHTSTAHPTMVADPEPTPHAQRWQRISQQWCTPVHGGRSRTSAGRLLWVFKAQISFIATISKMQDVSEMSRYPKCRDVMDSNRISPHAAAQSPKALNGH